MNRRAAAASWSSDSPAATRLRQIDKTRRSEFKVQSSKFKAQGKLQDSRGPIRSYHGRPAKRCGGHRARDDAQRVQCVGVQGRFGGGRSRRDARTTGSWSASLSPIPDVRNRWRIQDGGSLHRLRTSGIGKVTWFSWIGSGAMSLPAGSGDPAYRLEARCPHRAVQGEGSSLAGSHGRGYSWRRVSKVRWTRDCQASICSCSRASMRRRFSAKRS